jgi:hypothetical protein
MPGLEIAMHEAAFVRVMHRLADLGDEGQAIARRQVVLADVLAQGLPMDVLHGARLAVWWRTV